MKKLFLLMAAIVCTMTLYAQGVSFEWQGLRMTHPSNYRITDKEYNGETYNFNCEIKNDNISLISFSIVKDDLFKLLSKEDMIDVIKEAVVEMSEDLRQEYTSLKLGEVKVIRNHRYAYAYRYFVGKFMGVPICGKNIIICNGDKYVVMILQAESQSYLKELEEIVNSIRID